MGCAPWACDAQKGCVTARGARAACDARLGYGRLRRARVTARGARAAFDARLGHVMLRRACVTARGARAACDASLGHVMLRRAEPRGPPHSQERRRCVGHAVACGPGAQAVRAAWREARAAEL